MTWLRDNNTHVNRSEQENSKSDQERVVMCDEHKKAEWGLLVANADLQIAARVCSLIEDEAIVWADNRIKELEQKLTEYERPANWIRPFNMAGNLIEEFALYRPKLKKCREILKL